MCCKSQFGINKPTSYWHFGQPYQGRRPLPKNRFKSNSIVWKTTASYRSIEKCYLKPPAVPDYSKFDVTLLYTLIRNLCPLLRPTQGWGNEPQPKDTQLGDDIERLRLFRNNYYAHAVSKAISDIKFKILWQNLKTVINRIQSKTACSVNSWY